MPVQFMLDDLAIERIPVDTKNLGCLGLISSGSCKGRLNEFLFELIQSFIQINPAFDHLCNQRLQLLVHNFFPYLQSCMFPVAS